jgi:hypothetical protein
MYASQMSGAPGAMHQVNLVGDVEHARFPAMCARCCDTPAGTIPVVKLFSRSREDGPTVYHIARASVPFCQTCIGEHVREEQPVDPRILRKLRLRWAVSVLPYVIPIVVIVFMLSQFLPQGLRDLGTGDAAGAAIFLGVAGFFGLLLLMFLRLCLKAGRPLVHDAGRAPTYVRVITGALGRYAIPVAPTTTLAAVDFTDDVSDTFEPERHDFRFASGTIAQEFAALNADRIWQPSSLRAQGAQIARWVMYAAIAVVIVAGLLYEYAGLDVLALVR